MTTRPKALQDFLVATREAYESHTTDPKAVASLARIFGALETPAEGAGLGATRLPVCAHLVDVADPLRFEDPALRGLVEAFLSIEPLLAWRPRGGVAPGANAGFQEGHANAMIIGPAGLEPRRDVWLGVSLLAPRVRYPDHDHAPEETYLVLSEGEFSQDDGPWFAPGVGGSFYNPPGIRHAMRAGSTPLLALWALWADETA